MKKLFICLITLVQLSCSLADDTESNYIEFLPIENATLPDEFIRGETYDILITFKRPTDCHAFKDIFLETKDDGIFIAVMSTIFTGNYDCVAIDDTLERSFTFTPGNLDVYVFKFWHGSNDAGEDEYIIFEVPVVD